MNFFSNWGKINTTGGELLWLAKKEQEAKKTNV